MSSGIISCQPMTHWNWNKVSTWRYALGRYVFWAGSNGMEWKRIFVPSEITVLADLNWCKNLKSPRVGSQLMIEIVIFLIHSKEAKSCWACFMKLLFGWGLDDSSRTVAARKDRAAVTPCLWFFREHPNSFQGKLLLIQFNTFDGIMCVILERKKGREILL